MRYWLTSSAGRGFSPLMSSPDRAPRLRAYLQHAEGKSVLTMPREDWDRFRVTRGAVVLVDVTKTPMERVASEATVVAAVAGQFSNATAEVTIYRDDPADPHDQKW